MYSLWTGHVMNSCDDGDHLYTREGGTGPFVCTDCGNRMKYDEFMKAWQSHPSNQKDSK